MAGDHRGGDIGDVVALDTAVAGRRQDQPGRRRRRGFDGERQSGRGGRNVAGDIGLGGGQAVAAGGQGAASDRPGAASADHGGAEQRAAVVEGHGVAGRAGAGDRRGGDVGDVVALDTAVAGRRQGQPGRRRRRRHFEHRAIVVRPTRGCRAEQVPFGVDDQTGLRVRPVVAVEGDQSGRRAGVAAAGLGDLEHRAKAPPADFCRAEQVPFGVDDQTGLRATPVGAVETDQNGRRAGVDAVDFGDLEHSAIPRPAAVCRAEQVPGGIGDQTGLPAAPVGAVEGDQSGRRAGVAADGLGNLEHGATGCRAEQVAGGVGYQTGRRVGPGETVEGDQSGRRACVTADGLGDLERRATIINPPARGCRAE